MRPESAAAAAAARARLPLVAFTLNAYVLKLAPVTVGALLPALNEFAGVRVRVRRRGRLRRVTRNVRRALQRLTLPKRTALRPLPKTFTGRLSRNGRRNGHSLLQERQKVVPHSGPQLTVHHAQLVSQRKLDVVGLVQVILGE